MRTYLVAEVYSANDKPRVCLKLMCNHCKTTKTMQELYAMENRTDLFNTPAHIESVNLLRLTQFAGRFAFDHSDCVERVEASDAV